MKLLVLAQTPPPVHGQSVMIGTLIEGLPSRGIPVRHVNLRLSLDAADIGQWRPRKIAATLGCALHAIMARFKHGCDTLYYVPAPPGKRGALYRDWVLMAMCRPFFRRLVLHWHAAGLGEWLAANGNAFERAMTRALLGRAELNIVLADALRADAGWLRAKRIAIVPNGISDPGEPAPPKLAAPFHVVFVGLCSAKKGVFRAAHAVLRANAKNGAPQNAPAFVFTAAGPFDGETSAAHWRQLAESHPRVLQHIGVVSGEAKRALFGSAHILCFPTQYPAEAQPLVALEALAHDRPVVTTRWRALPEVITPAVGRLVPPSDESALVEALLDIRDHPPPRGACRARYLARYTLEQHLELLAQTFHSLDASSKSLRPPF